MASHHFIGKGLISAQLGEMAPDAGGLIGHVDALVKASDLEVVAHQSVDFEGGGLTIVWVLAESHLVLHHWPKEGFATIDLHVCDYRASNMSKATRLAAALAELCFADRSAAWQELHLADPAVAPVSSTLLGATSN